MHICTLILFLSLFLLPCTKSTTAATACNQRCGDRKVQFPFGFSSGCQIQLNCSSNATILAASDFPVQSLTSDTILINLPATCGRPVEAFGNLFTQNYAPNSLNAILLMNCSAPIRSCLVPTVKLRSNFQLPNCGAENENISCYTETDNRFNTSFIDYGNLMRSGCETLFSSISVESSADNSNSSVSNQILKVGWWLLGECRCSENSKCIRVSPPIEGNPPAYRCECELGFVGDGYRDGLGCRKEGSKHKSPTKYIIAFSTVGLMLILCFSYIIYRRRMTRKTGNRGSNETSPVLLFSYESGRQIDENDKGNIDVPFYKLDTILSATDNFSDANKLGRGGFGPVYKGKFPGGHEIAVKRLSSCSSQGGIDEFLNEVTLIAKLQHRNLVRLLGYCIKKNEKILLYEYMSNRSLNARSLNAFIFDQNNSLLLDWRKRFDIILGIARGLLYLHQDSRLRIIHRDLKTSNILLDSEMNPKISDFGLARIVQGKGTEASTNKVVGTYGYMSPEYALDGKFSIKSDVFSFGVVMLEIISGKKNTGFYHPQQVLNLLGYAWRVWSENKTLHLVDPTMLVLCDEPQVIKCINIGLLCVQEDPNDRPSMSNVVIMLGSETGPLPVPNQPAFVVRRPRSAKPDTISNNELTISTAQGR